MSYFIKRKGNVFGPFTAAQVKSGIRSKQLVVGDMVCDQQNGQYADLQSVAKEVIADRWQSNSQEEVIANTDTETPRGVLETYLQEMRTGPDVDQWHVKTWGHILTKEHVETYARSALPEDVGCPQLGFFLEIEDDAADALSRLDVNTMYEGGHVDLRHLLLNKLYHISDPVAESLRVFLGDSLQLNGLKALSGAAAKSLGRGRFGELELNGLATLSDAAAQGLGGGLLDSVQLNGLTTLSDAAAQGLGSGRLDSVQLNGVTTLSDAAAQGLGGGRLASVQLNGLTTLSDAAAQGLGGLGGVSLMGLKDLSLEAAQALTKDGECYVTTNNDLMRCVPDSVYDLFKKLAANDLLWLK